MRDEPLHCSQAGTDVMVLPQPLRKQAPLSGIITAFMVLEFRPTDHQNNKQLHYWPTTTTPCHTFLIFQVKPTKQLNHKGMLVGIFSEVSASIMTQTTLMTKLSTIQGNYHYYSAFIRRTPQFRFSTGLFCKSGASLQVQNGF